jgi:hypothetical protein
MPHRDRPLHDVGDLALALGGADSSFTGELLRLIAKADPANRERLREGYPRQVRAWELWMGTTSPLTETELLHALDGVPSPASRIRVVLWTNGMVGVFGPDGEQMRDYQGAWRTALPRLLADLPDGVSFRVSHAGHWLLPVPRAHVETLAAQLAAPAAVEVAS